MRLTTLNISSNVIKYTATNGSGTVKHGSAAPEGLINNGLILQPDTIASQIKSMFSTNSLPRDRVICSINGLPFSYRLFTLPRMETGAFNEAILRETRKEMPISLEEMYLSWQAYRTENDEWQVLVTGVTRQPVDNLIKTLRAAGIHPYYLDLQHLSLARLTDEKDAVIVDMEKDYSNIVMLVEGVPQALNIIPALGPEAALQDEVWSIADKVIKTVNFYNGSHSRKPVKDTVKVLLTGALANDGKAVEIFRQGVSYPVELLTPTNKVVPGLPVHEFAANAGSALMNVVTEKERGKDAPPHRSISLGKIASDLQGGDITGRWLKRLLVPIGIVAGLAALLFAYQSQNDVQTTISGIETELAQAKAALGQIQTSLDNAGATEKAISEIETRLQNVDSSYLAVTEANDYVADIAAITRSEPAGVSYLSLSIDSSGIGLSGDAAAPQLIIQFARNLETAGGFSKANIEWIDVSPTKVGMFGFVINIAR
jgi:Tfp pilus assembly PilM family ATPase